MTTLDCRASWDGVLIGGFTFGVSTIGGTDVFTSVYTADFGGTYDNVSSLVKSASWQRGRNDLNSNMLAGSGSVTIIDETGLYNPANPSSPLAGKLLPLRPFYIKATDSGGIVRGCFRGFLQDEPTHDASQNPATTTFALVDLFVILAGIFPVILSTGPTTTGAAIGRVLDAAGFTDTSLRLLATGDSIADFSADGSTSGLDLIRELLNAEQGSFFINGAGAAVYLDRDDRFHRSSMATISGVASRVATSGPFGNIINRTSVTAGAGVEQKAENDASIAQFNFRDGGSVSSPYLANDAAALALAQLIVSRGGVPRTLLQQLELLSPVGTNLDQILQREFGDRITIPAAGAGTTGITGDFFIEQISVDAAGGGVLDCTWILSQRGPADVAFMVGVSTIGSTDPLTL